MYTASPLAFSEFAFNYSKFSGQKSKQTYPINTSYKTADLKVVLRSQNLKEKNTKYLNFKT